jgi:DNA-binding response OmpR family regulator
MGEMRVLVVEDEPRLADFMLRALRAEGWTVTHAADGAEALRLGRDGGFDVIVLDVMLPGPSGRDVCRALRDEGVATRILMLTALADLDDRVAGLRLGADDYLGKPFALDELLARIEALGRRSAGSAGGPEALTCGALRFDPVSLDVSVEGVAVVLTARERDMLRLLMTSPGRAFSRERILNSLWSAHEDPMTNIIDVYVARLRRKLGDAGDMIETVRGVGYRLRPTVAEGGEA